MPSVGSGRADTALTWAGLFPRLLRLGYRRPVCPCPQASDALQRGRRDGCPHQRRSGSRPCRVTSGAGRALARIPRCGSRSRATGFEGRGVQISPPWISRHAAGVPAVRSQDRDRTAHPSPFGGGDALHGARWDCETGSVGRRHTEWTGPRRLAMDSSPQNLCTQFSTGS